MKKSLFAIAAVTAFAGAAQAQSSVTVYGILDVGFTGADNKAVPTGAGRPQIKSTSAQFGQSAETTSRLGFKGSEDLGGGLSGIFTAEFQLYPQSGTLSSDTQSTAGTGLVNRQTFVGLKKNGLGQAAIGTQYTPVFQSVAASDPGQTNNVVGSIIYPAKANGNDISVPSFTVRQGNSITFNTVSFAGFSAKGMYVQNNKDSTQVGTDNQYTAAQVVTNATAGTPIGGTYNTNGWGIGADYTWKKLYVVAAFQNFKNQSNVSNVTLTTANTAIDNGINTSSNESYAAATYDFGIAKAYVNWVSRKVTSVLNSNNYGKRAGQQIGVRSYITPTIEAWGTVGTGRYTAYGAGEPTANMNAWQLGSNYYLSKRTNLYAIYGKAQTSNIVSVAGVNGSAAASQYAIGVRHTF
jgi:predicted porin